MSRIFLSRGQVANYKNIYFPHSNAYRNQDLHTTRVISSFINQVKNQQTIQPQYSLPKEDKFTKQNVNWETSCHVRATNPVSFDFQKKWFHSFPDKKEPIKSEKTSNQAGSTKNIFTSLSEKLGLNDLFKGAFGAIETQPTKDKIEVNKSNTHNIKIGDILEELTTHSEILLPKESEALYRVALELTKKENFTQEQNNFITVIRDTLRMQHGSLKKGNMDTDLLQKILDNLVQLNEQTKQSRQERSHQSESSKAETTSEFEKLDHKMDEAELSRIAQLRKLEELLKSFQELLKKQEESANSRLSLWVAYTSILGFLFTVLVFLYQYNQSSEKEREEKEAQAEKARNEAEALAKKVEKLQLKYTGLINQKEAIEESIKNLEQNRAELVSLKSRWFVNTTLEIGIKQQEAKIGQEKIQLQYVLSEIKKLELYVTKQQEFEEEKNKRAIVSDETPTSNTSNADESPIMRPFN